MRNSFLGLWVLGNGGYPVTDLQLRRKLKTHFFF